jgi:predicted nucleic acid-binding protein
LDFRRAALADLALLDIKTDQQTDSHAWTDTLNLADQFRLSVYDAAYLELAREECCHSPRSIRNCELPQRPSV